MPHRGAVLSIVLVSYLMIVLEISIVITALPAMPIVAAVGNPSFL